MLLIELIARSPDGNRLLIVVQPLPTRTAIATTKSPGEPPNPTIVVQLIELVALRDNCHGLLIII